MVSRLVISLENLPPPDVTQWATKCIEWPILLTPYILGYLEHLKYPDVWQGDDETRSILTALVSTAMASLMEGKACSVNECPECGETNGHQPGFEIFSDCEECGMANCSIPYGALKYIDGKLHYLYCGEWYEVLGTSPGSKDGDELDLGPVDNGQNEFYACGKARTVADTLIGVAHSIWVASSEYPWDWVSTVKSDWPSISFGEYDLYNAVLWVKSVKGDFLDVFFPTPTPSWGETDLLPIDLADEIACRLVSYMDDSADVDSDNLYNSLVAVLGQVAPLPDTVPAATLGFWGYVLNAIGRGDLTLIAKAGSLDATANCDCPEPPVGELSSIRFSGTVVGPNSSGGVLEAYHTEQGGRRMWMQFAYSAGGSDKGFTDCEPQLTGAVAGDYVTIRVYPDAYSLTNPGVPTLQQQDTCDDVTKWLAGPPTIHGGGTITRVDNQEGGYVEFTSEDLPAAQPTAFDFAGWRCPHENAQDYRISFFLEIVAVNGVQLTPIGP